MGHVVDQAFGERFAIYQGDSCELIRDIPDNSVGGGGHSPPFWSMYAYTPSARDIGNCTSMAELLRHYRHIVRELYRITMPGRSHWVHLAQAVSFKKDGDESGIIDFRGSVIREYQRAGWIFRGEVAIETNPQLKAIRTHDNGLLFVSLAKDAADMHMALNDFALQFRKPGENPVPIRAGKRSGEKGNENPTGWISDQNWIDWANGTWRRKTPDFPQGIHREKVLNVIAAREKDDEVHLCPIQLDVVKRWVLLGTNPLDFSFREAHEDLKSIPDALWEAGATFYTPFLGIGSEVYEAVLNGRRGVGSELKGSYFKQAVVNSKRAEAEVLGTQTLFDLQDLALV